MKKGKWRENKSDEAYYKRIQLKKIRIGQYCQVFKQPKNRYQNKM
jgi:hypothetical protein